MADNPRQNVTFASNGGEAHGYLALPESGSGPGVIVIQEWWGLTQHVVDVTDRLAADGFVALAPDLFGGTTTHDAEEAGRLMAGAPGRTGRPRPARARSTTSSPTTPSPATRSGPWASAWVAGSCSCWPPRPATRSARPCPTTPSSTPRTIPTCPASRAPVLGHFGGEDDFAGPERARQIEQAIIDQAGVDVRFDIHPGAGHAFFNDGNAFGTYDAELAESTWSETVAFLRSNLS